MVQLTKDESRAITLAKVICMFGVVFIHAAIKKYTDCSPLVEFYYNFLTRVLVNFAARIQQASAKLRNVFVKALLWC